MFSYLFVTSAIAFILFTVRGLFSHSWLMWWLSALFSYIASVISGFSIGGAVFLITCLQIATVLVVGGVVPRRLAPLGILLSVVIWLVLVPFQIYGYAWLGGFGIYGLAGLLALITTPVLCLHRQRITALLT